MTLHESFTSLQQPLIRALTKTTPNYTDPSQTSHLTHRWTLNGQQLHTILGINRALPTLHPTPTIPTSIPPSAPPSVAPTARLSTIDPEVEDTPEYAWLMIMRHSTQYMRQARTWMSSVYGYTPIITTAPLRRSTSPVKSILKRQTVTPLTSLPSQSWCNMASTLLSCDMWLLMDIQDVWQDMTRHISCTRIERWLMACLAILYGQAHTWILCFGSQLYLDFCSATHDHDYLRTLHMDEKEERKRTVSDVDEEADDTENDNSDAMIQQRWIMRWRIRDEELEHRIDMEEIQQIPDLDPLMDVERCKLVARFFGISDHAMIMTLQQHDLMYTSHVTCRQFKSLFYHLFQQQLAYPQHTATLESWNDGGLMIQRSLTTTTTTSSNDSDHSFTRCPRCVIL